MDVKATPSLAPERYRPKDVVSARQGLWTLLVCGTGLNP